MARKPLSPWKTITALSQVVRGYLVRIPLWIEWAVSWFPNPLSKLVRTKVFSHTMEQARWSKRDGVKPPQKADSLKRNDSGGRFHEHFKRGFVSLAFALAGRISCRAYSYMVWSMDWNLLLNEVYLIALQVCMSYFGCRVYRVSFDGSVLSKYSLTHSLQPLMEELSPSRRAVPLFLAKVPFAAEDCLCDRVREYYPWQSCAGIGTIPQEAWRYIVF